MPVISAEAGRQDVLSLCGRQYLYVQTLVSYSIKKVKIKSSFKNFKATRKDAVKLCCQYGLTLLALETPEEETCLKEMNSN